MSLPATVKALQTQEDKKSVKLIDLPFAEQDKVKNLHADEIIIKVRAVGINPTDWKHAIGSWGVSQAIVGCDASGDVVKIGSNVKHLQVGDRVFAFTYGSTQPDNGAYAEYARFRANAAVKIPTGMSYAEAAGFPIPFHTAVQALYNRLALQLPFSESSPKTNILVWGGATSVGHHTIQLAHLSGYRVITTASKKNHEYLKSIGADVTIDYNDVDALAQIKEAVKEGGLQFAVDTVTEKGSTDTIIDAITTPTGHVVTSLPISPETANRKSGVTAAFTLVYTAVVDGDFKFGNVVPIKGDVKDHQAALDFNVNQTGKLFEGWEEGKGSKFYKPQKLRIGNGLDKVQEGLEYMRDGKVSAEKLVYIVQ